MVVMSVTMVMEAKEDLYRHAKDGEVNSSISSCLCVEENGHSIGEHSRRWKDIKVHEIEYIGFFYHSSPWLSAGAKVPHC